MIKFENVTKECGDKRALDSLTLEIKAGEIFGLIGHNGTSKTTTIIKDSKITSIDDLGKNSIVGVQIGKIGRAHV